MHFEAGLVFLNLIAEYASDTLMREVQITRSALPVIGSEGYADMDINKSVG